MKPVNEVPRCVATIDIEDAIKLAPVGPKKPTHATCIVTYKSGRKEELTAPLNKDGSQKKVFSQKVLALKAFPTVTNVKITTFAR